MTPDWLDRMGKRNSPGGRRQQPRIPALGAFCIEISDEQERFSIISDLSPRGLRLHRPYRGPQRRMVQLEFDLPGVDELIWARGAVSFDRVWQADDGQVLHTTGVELVRAAGKHLRLLRDYAFDHEPRAGHYAERRAAIR